MTSSEAETVRLDPADNVVTAVRPLAAGVAVEGAATRSLIPRGHKIAIRAIAEGEPVLKYAQVIGYAAAGIAPGEHVHTHNLEFRGTRHDYEFSTDLRPVAPVPEAERDSFLGFRRANGRCGTRNYIAVLTSVNCSATAARKIATAFGPAELGEQEKTGQHCGPRVGHGFASAARHQKLLQRVSPVAESRLPGRTVPHDRALTRCGVGSMEALHVRQISRCVEGRDADACQRGSRG